MKIICLFIYLSVLALGQDIGSKKNAQYDLITKSGEWIPGNGVEKSVSFLYKNSNALFAGLENSGVIMSIDNGIIWSNISNGIEESPVTSIIMSSDILLAGTWESGLFNYNNMQKYWQRYSTDSTIKYIADLAVLGTDLFLGDRTGIIYKSSDKGHTWNIVLEDIGTVWDIEICNNIIYATTNYSLYKSTDNGNNWEATFDEENNGYPFFLASTNEEIFVVANGLFSSNDYGITWVKRADNYFSTFVVSSNIIIGGIFTENEVLLSDNGGANWKDITDNLPDSVDILDIIISDGEIIIATRGGSGIYHRALSDIVSTVLDNGNIPNKYELLQNYPNPFNPSTTISYSLPEAVNVKLIVYDMLGREVKSLVDETKSAGTYTIQYNARNLSSGMYLYKLIAGNYIAVKKMVVMK